MQKQITINSIEKINDIVEYIKIFCYKINSKNIILLDSNLGGGKTTFTRYFINSFRSSLNVTSPTFNFVNIYKINPSITISHFDLYNIKSIDDFFNLSLYEHIDNSNISIIEWPNIAYKYIKENYCNENIIKIKIKNEYDDNEEKRKFILSY